MDIDNLGNGLGLFRQRSDGNMWKSHCRKAIIESTARRPGDPARLVASSQKIYEELAGKQNIRRNKSSKARGNGINTESPVEQVSTGDYFSATVCRFMLGLFGNCRSPSNSAFSISNSFFYSCLDVHLLLNCTPTYSTDTPRYLQWWSLWHINFSNLVVSVATVYLFFRGVLSGSHFPTHDIMSA